MEKNQIIGFALIFVIIMAWSVINKPDIELEEAPNTSNTEQTYSADESSYDSKSMSETINTQIPTESDINLLNDQYGVFSSNAQGTESIDFLENDKFKIAFTNKGGRIKYVELKDYKKLKEDENGQDIESLVRLFEDEKNRFNYKLSVGNRTINTEELYGSINKSNNSISYNFLGNDGSVFKQTYTISPDSYLIDYNLSTKGLSSDLSKAQLEIKNYLDKIEKNYTFEKTVSTVYFKERDEDSDYCNCRSDDIEDQSDKKIKWFSFANQFFNTSIIADNRSFDGLIASTEVYDESNEDMKLTKASVSIPIGDGENDFGMSIFAGPNEYELLTQVDSDLEQIIPFGRSIFGSINRHFIRPFFNLLAGMISSKGIVIILIIFIIKMALYPLTYKMLHSQAKMGALKPEIAKMGEKFKDDAQKKQMETMKLYREYGVNPMGGCMPMFIQMPIWYALFRFFPASITFRQESFLWAQDLSSFDEILSLPFAIPGFGSHLSLFTILWAITTVIYTYYNMKHMDMSANPAMKYVQYLMPIMFFVFFNNYASGLTCYMFFSQLFNIAQTVLTKKYVFDDKKILEELNVKKAQPKKKSGFQAKLAEAMEKQQRLQEQKAAAKKKKKK